MAVYAPAKQERSQAKLERLLLAGRELFAAEGVEGTRITDVVERAGCSVGVFYQRFADKDAFFRAVRDHFLEEIAATTAELNAHAAELGGVALLRAYIAHGVVIFRHNARLIRAFLQYEVSHPDSEAPMRALVEARAQRLIDAVHESGARLAHPRESIAIQVGAHVVRGALLQEALHGPGLIPLDDDELVDELTRLFTGYLGLEA
jgi:AcrR family transcriptional regulator